MASNSPVFIDQIEIKRVKEVKFLGILIDEDLKWSNHIESIISKVIKFCGIFYKLKCRMPPSVLKSVYFSLVHSHFIYGIEIYANTYAKYLHPLIKINNKILRILQNKELKTPINCTLTTTPYPFQNCMIYIFCSLCTNIILIKIIFPLCFTIISN